MIDKIKTVLNSYFWLFVVIGLAIIAAVVFWIGGIVEEKSFDNNISSGQSQANSAVREAQNSTAAAANYSIERRSEDAVREKVIAPKLDDVRRRSSASKIEIEKAKKNYEIKKSDTSNLSDSDADNCRELLRLYPNVRFEGCQQN